MTNKNGGQGSEAEFEPGLPPANLSGRSRTAPVIEGEAVENPADGEESARQTAERRETQAEVFSEEQAGLVPDKPEPDPAVTLQEEQAEALAEGQAGLNSEQAEPGPATPGPATGDASMDPPPVNRPVAATPSKMGVFGSFAALLGLLVLGGGAYYGWELLHRPHVQLAPKVAAIPDRKPSPTAPEAEPVATLHGDAPVAAPSSAESAPKVETKAKSEETPTTPSNETVAPAQETPGTAQLPADKTENSAPLVAPVIAPEAVLAPVEARLDRMQETLDRLTQRLQMAEAQMAAPKSDSRVEIAARDAGPANASEASARVIAAQSLLTALQQGQDGAAMLAALEASGGDPARLNSLRAGLAAPTPAQLASEFHNIAPRLLASIEPAVPAEAPQHGAAAGLLAFVEARAKKLVRVRPVGDPEENRSTGAIAHIETALDNGDLAAALKERATLPESAQAISADWAKMAQARLDAESAAKAELTDAFNTLGKRKS